MRQVVARVPALGGEPGPSERRVGPSRPASPALAVVVGERSETHWTARSRGRRGRSRSSSRGSREGPPEPARRRPRPRIRGPRVADPASARAGRSPVEEVDPGFGVFRRPSSGQCPRPVGEERIVQGEQGLLGDGRLAPGRDVQVRVGEVEDPEDARQDLAIDQAVERPADVRRGEQVGRPASHPPVEFAGDGQHRVAGLLEREAVRIHPPEQAVLGVLIDRSTPARPDRRDRRSAAGRRPKGGSGDGSP